ncbi:hypothetical protein [Streptomyces sp. enrichment culture]|uniref:hypothetical protein n=1 Tax=Streptomyces sp. enrichment culture TaxID=1795815 RepID=UPI003F575AC9
MARRRASSQDNNALVEETSLPAVGTDPIASLIAGIPHIIVIQDGAETGRFRDSHGEAGHRIRKDARRRMSTRDFVTFDTSGGAAAWLLPHDSVIS